MNKMGITFADYYAEMDGLMRDAIGHFGVRAQLEKAVEELDELRDVISLQIDHIVEREDHLVEEVADVYNILDQICMIYAITDEVRNTALEKMRRTLRRIEEGGENGGNQATGD